MKKHFGNTKLGQGLAVAILMLALLLPVILAIYILK